MDNPHERETTSRMPALPVGVRAEAVGRLIFDLAKDGRIEIEDNLIVAVSGSACEEIMEASRGSVQPGSGPRNGADVGATAALATAYYDGFVDGIMRQPWEDAADWAALQGQEYAKTGARPPFIPVSATPPGAVTVSEEMVERAAEAFYRAQSYPHKHRNDPVKAALWLETDAQYMADEINAVLVSVSGDGCARYIGDVVKDLSTLLASHAALVEEVAHWKAEHEMLQDILDTRPAINAGLPDSYIRWSQGVMSGDVARALLSGKATS